MLFAHIRSASLSRLPHVLTAIRVATAPALVISAVLGSRPGFLALLAVALATELDGTIARRLGVASDFGRVFDSWADLATQVGALLAFPLLWPELARANAWFYLVGGVALVAPVFWALLTRGRPLAFHSYLARFAGALVAAGVAAFAAWNEVTVLRVSAVLEVVVALEYLTIAMVLPNHTGVVLSLRHAVRLAAGQIAETEGR
jgi:CDP-diacylglycerol--glycerol-3-phosphate 3-phosphatidyltransferase